MLRNYVLETANPPGTNANVLLGGALSGRVTWRSAYTDGSQVFYFIDDGQQAEWGVGTMHYGPPDTISRDTVVGNTATNQSNPSLPRSRLNFTAAVQVYSEIPAERMAFVHQNVLWAPGAYLDPHAGGFPIGGTVDYYGGAPPAGWVWVNGQGLSRTGYPFLFAVLGTGYGAPDANSFNVPNRCEQFSVGRAFMGGAGGVGRLPLANISNLGAWIGDYRTQAHTHGLNWADPGHAHAVADPGHSHPIFDPGHVHAYRHVGLVSGIGLAAGANYTFVEDWLNTDDGGVRGTGVSDYAVGVGISIYAAGTGISASIATAGSGGQENIPPAVVCNVIMFAGPFP